MVKVMRECKLVKDAVESGFNFRLPDNFKYIPDSEAVYFNGTKLYKGMYKHFYFYNIVEKSPREIKITIDMRIMSGNPPEDSSVEALFWIQSETGDK